MRRIAAAAVPCVLLAQAMAQEVTIPTVGDSPTALQLCRRAEDLRDTNPEESARLVQRVLSEYADRLVPMDEGGDRFVPASARVLSLVSGSPKVRAEWDRVIAPAVERYRDEGDDASLVRIAPLSPDGLLAALRLAQRDLEAGRPAAALAHLRPVADTELARIGTSRDRAFVRSMRARALARLGEFALADVEVAALAALVTEDRALEPIAAALERERAHRLADASPAAPIDAASAWHRIWRLPLPNAPYTRRYLNPLTGPLLNLPTAAQAADEGSLMTVSPLAVGDRVFINEGHVITAIDRLSRRVRWQQTLADEDAEVVPISDLSSMALAGDTLIVLTGHGSATRRTGGGRLFALDAETGAVRWEQLLARLEPPDIDGGEGLFPHSAPLIIDDTVIVMARKMNARIESVATLAGFDLATGAPRWMTYLVGGGNRPMSSMRAFSDPVASKGSVFVSSSLGATARIDVDRGTIRWLARFPVPVTEISRWPLPWETSAPAIIDNGLLTIAPDGVAVLLLDLENGEVRRSFTTGAGEAWGAPRSLLASPDGRFVLSIGDDILLFGADELDRPRWRLSTLLADAGIKLAPTAVRGRLAFAEGLIDGRRAAVIPLADRVLVVDVERAVIVRVIETGSPGNVLLAGGQVLHAAGDRLDCFMPLESAERAVRNWMARDPDDPTRSLALLELGIQCAVPSMIFEGVATTVAAVDRTGDDGVRTELLQRLLNGAMDLDLPDDTMRQLIAAAHASARAPSHQIACAVAEGAWELRRNRATEAVAAWQRVLASNELRRTMVIDPESEIPASAIVMARLVDLVQMVGPSALVARERAAEQALRAVGADATIESLVEVAEAWTGSAAGVAAAQRAVAALVSSGRPRDAFILTAQSMRNRSRLAGMEAGTRSLVATLSSLARSEGWNEAAALELVALLDRTSAGAGSAQDITAVRDAILALAPAHPAVRRWPEVGLIAEGGTSIPGRLAQLVPAAEAERPSDRALFVGRRDGSETQSDLTLRRGESLERVWSHPIDVDDPVVLAFGKHVVLWQSGQGVEPSIIALDAADGTLAWTLPVVAEVFDRSRPTAAAAITQHSPRDSNALSMGEVTPFRADPWLILVRRNGDVACVDMRDGAVKWRLDGLIETVIGAEGARTSLVAANAWVVAVGGTRRTADGALESTLVLLDPARGTVLDTIDLAGELEWVSLAPGPIVLASARNEVTAFVPGRPERAWSRIDHRLGHKEPGPQAGDTKLLVPDRGVRRDEIVALDLLQGVIQTDRFIAPARRTLMRSTPESLQRIGDAIVTLASDRLVLFDPTGRIIGQDAIAIDRNFGSVLPSQTTLMVIDPESAIAYQTNPDRPVGSSSGAVLYQLSRREGAKLLVDPIVVPMSDRADRWALVDGAVVGSGTSRSVCVLLPSGPAR